MRKNEQFLKQLFFHAAPALAGPRQPAQKEVGLTRKRGGVCIRAEVGDRVGIICVDFRAAVPRCNVVFGSL